MSIKAIETRYKGYRFRSRIEARWAVFFDACEEQWVYENEGFALPSGHYLPDFFFPKRNAFIEVKPSINPVTHFEFGLEGLVHTVSRQIKAREIVDAFSRPINDLNLPHELILAYEVFSVLNLVNDHFVVVYGDPREVLTHDGGGCVSFDRKGMHTNTTLFDCFHCDNHRGKWHACDLSRAARFEHGEVVA